ncbi:hypothetical protein QTP88_011624 [Uroleucon formosanum]
MADKWSTKKQSTENKLQQTKQCETLRNHENVSGDLSDALVGGSGQLEMRRGRRSARRRSKRSRRRRGRRRSVRGTEEEDGGDDYDTTTDTEDDDSLTVDATSRRRSRRRRRGSRRRRRPYQPSGSDDNDNTDAEATDSETTMEVSSTSDVVDVGGEGGGRVDARIDVQEEGMGCKKRRRKRRRRRSSSGGCCITGLAGDLAEISVTADHRCTTTNRIESDTANRTQ